MSATPALPGPHAPAPLRPAGPDLPDASRPRSIGGLGAISRRRAAVYVAFGLLAIASGLAGRALAWRAIVPRPLLAPAFAPTGGSLLICGGGRTPEEVRARFIELAGGPDARIVVIPTAHAAADSAEADAVYLAPWRDRGVKAVSLFHTRDRKRADDPAFARALADASGVWITGGKQSMLADAYRDTEVERQLKKLMERGGVIGGTSAGAAIMTRVMIQSGRREAVEGLGFDLFPDAVVDQHFLKRRRMNRLMGLLTKHPGLLGFGIDEATALLVQGNRLSVLGESYVVACLPGADGQAPKAEFLRRGDEADLASLKGPEPRIVSAIDPDEEWASER